MNYFEQCSKRLQLCLFFLSISCGHKGNMAELSDRHASCLYFGMELPNDGTNEVSEDGFDGISLKVICHGRKCQISTFSHIYLYSSVVQRCCSIFLHHVASLE